jgi:hypothetical protein
LSTASVEVIEISSSYELSIFSSRAGSQSDEGAVAAPDKSSSDSIGEFWPDINKLDEINCAGTSVIGLSGGALHEWRSAPLVPGMSESTKPATKRASLDNAPGLSTVLPRGYCGGFARNKATWIMSTASEAVSPRMRRSFVDR